ncbi:AraC family transcriptional regulator [Paenibacillus flagellatus]|uniref:AraC family transcriptional regulator n=1 Tax=Paenibacillus flagellatus TaxID=2211139 RepID=A0A2V5KE38_9BACL|nr:AraC family transcriptional regulator [Paenibacillus flagellatus]PYI56574.1 AraC family transcriptional regulator [Paenibacillus flagellatus]
MTKTLSLGEAVVVPFIRQADYASRLPWSYGERRLLDYLIVYVERGHCRFTVNRRAYELHPGDVCFVQPGDSIALEGLTETRTPFAHLDFFYNPLREQSFPTSAGMTNLDRFADLMQPRLNDMPGVDVPAVFRPPQPMTIVAPLLRMIGKWKEGTVMGGIEAQRLGIDLLLELLRTFGGRSSDGKEAPTAMMERVLSYMSLRLNEPITVKQMASLAHLSPSRFTAVFREKYGVAPYRYLLRLRVERAIEMLRAGPEPGIGQIAEYCGFRNVQHFSLAFRKMTGKPPSAYRAKNP